MRTLVTPAVVVETMKRQAARLKKSLNMPHHAALEKVARDHGYHHWHHVSLSEKATAPAEEALRHGWVIGLDVVSSDRFAQATQRQPDPLLAELVEWDYRREPDPYEGAANEMAAFQRLIYFVGPGAVPPNAEAARSQLAEFGVEPLALWLGGERVERPRY